MVLALFFVLPEAQAQLPPLQAPPSWGQASQNAAACSVEKSCADLAPGMIRNALGKSPLEQNTRALEQILASGGDAASAEARATAWAEAALRRSRADKVDFGKFEPTGSQQVVIGEVRGREYPQDYVLLVAPLGGPGFDRLASAEDAAVLVDAVRVMQATGNIPRRSIYFMFFIGGADSSGGKLAGLWAYVQEHQASLDHVVAAVSVDAAGGPLDGYSLEGRPEMLPAVQEALQPLRSLGIRNFSEGVQVRADVMPLWLEGVPVLVATPAAGTSTSGDSSGGIADHGTLSAAKLQQLKRGVAVAAVTAYALADAATRVGAHRSPAAVQQSIDTLGLESKLRAAGVWSEWKAAESKMTR